MVAKRLVQRQSRRPRADPIRQLYVTPEIGELLDGLRVGTGFPDFAADVEIGKYIAGWLMLVSLSGNPVPAKEPTLERLTGLDETWAFCVRTPPPGWRIFGRFLDRGLFIGLRAHDRNALNGRATYSTMAQTAIADWAAVIGPDQPLRANSIDAYVGGVWDDADQNN